MAKLLDTWMQTQELSQARFALLLSLLDEEGAVEEQEAMKRGDYSEADVIAQPGSPMHKWLMEHVEGRRRWFTIEDAMENVRRQYNGANPFAPMSLDPLEDPVSKLSGFSAIANVEEIWRGVPRRERDLALLGEDQLLRIECERQERLGGVYVDDCVRL